MAPENSRTNLLINEPVVLLATLAATVAAAGGGGGVVGSVVAVAGDVGGEATTPNLRWRFRRRDAF